MIKFKLHELDEVSLFGQAPGYSVSWFALTDGYYWLDLKGKNFYEYTSEFLNTIERKEDEKFVDYFIVRLLEDFTELFPEIGEDIPDDLYQLIKTPRKLKTFLTITRKYCEQHADDENGSGVDNFYVIESWLDRRTLHAGHFLHAPRISFLRRQDTINVVWIADATTQGLCVWTAQTGKLTMNFSTFVKQLEAFGDEFFFAMETQVQKAIAKDWGDNIEIDKPGLLVEHQQRKDEFSKSLDMLKNTTVKTDWSSIRALINSKLNATLGRFASSHSTFTP
jgi:hypothetical protein